MTGKDQADKGFFEKFASNDKWRKIAIGVGLAGIALIFLSGLFQNNAKSGDAAKAASQPPTVQAQDYAGQLEQDLTDIITRISGAGSAKVLVTLEKDAEHVYATEEKKSTRTENSGTNNDDTETNLSIIKGADGGQQALKVTEYQPVVKGVVVVCQGGGDPVVQQNITNAVTTALNITSVRVCVIQSNE